MRTADRSQSRLSSKPAVSPQSQLRKLEKVRKKPGLQSKLNAVAAKAAKTKGVTHVSGSELVGKADERLVRKLTKGRVLVKTRTGSRVNPKLPRVWQSAQRGEGLDTEVIEDVLYQAIFDEARREAKRRKSTRMPKTTTPITKTARRPDGGSQAPQAVDHETLDIAVRLLPLEDRDFLTLARTTRTVQEAAERLNISYQTAKKRLQRTRRRMLAAIWAASLNRTVMEALRTHNNPSVRRNAELIDRKRRGESDQRIRSLAIEGYVFQGDLRLSLPKAIGVLQRAVEKMPDR